MLEEAESLHADSSVVVCLVDQWLRVMIAVRRLCVGIPDLESFSQNVCASLGRYYIIRY